MSNPVRSIVNGSDKPAAASGSFGPIEDFDGVSSRFAETWCNDSGALVDLLTSRLQSGGAP